MSPVPVLSPYKTGDIDDLGVTDRYGNITIQEGLSAEDFAETLLHESVHRFFSPRNTGPINRLRAAIGEEGYFRSSLVRYIEEALAEGIAKKSIREGLKYSITSGYVTVGRTLFEAGAYVGGTGLLIWGAYELGDEIF